MMTKDHANAIMFAYRYEIFELENGVPTYGYELAQAVKDGYLVDFLSVETKLKFIEQGILTRRSKSMRTLLRMKTENYRSVLHPRH